MKEPTFEEYMLPVLKVMADDVARKNADIKHEVLAFMKIDSAELTEKQKNGNLKYQDNINFAISYLSMAGCLDRQSRGVYIISKNGLALLKNNPQKIDTDLLKEISPEFKTRMEGHHKNKDGKQKTFAPAEEEMNPREAIFEGARKYKETKKDELLSILKATTGDPQTNRDRDSAFEEVCFDLLIAMGYGYDSEAGFVTKKSRDGGIDGIIFADKLGFERVAYQSKRWNNPVRRMDVSQFIGDMTMAKCNKGVFITTSVFDEGAKKVAEQNSNLILIDGNKLVDLMYEYGIGVADEKPIKIKDIDNDYFAYKGF